MSDTKTYIQAYSMVSALGSGIEVHRECLVDITSAKNTSAYPLYDNREVPVFLTKGPFADMSGELGQFKTKNNQFILELLLYLDIEIKNTIHEFGKSRVGVIMGTSTSGILEGAEAIDVESGEIHEDFDYSLQEMSSPSKFVSSYLNLSGVSYTISTACSSGGRCFLEASNLIKNGICDAVIVGACDTINPLTVNGFASLEAVSDECTNPFSANRKGINIGEGAALFILTKSKCDLFLAGVGESSDGHHPSSPCPKGTGAISSMRQALEMANLESIEIDYINLHGTGTIKNDSMEAHAINEVFSTCPFVSSTKPFTGHCLGSAGAIEAAFSLAFLESESDEILLPIHVFDSKIAEDCIGLKFVDIGDKSKLDYVMSNSYAFGGNNCSLIFGKI